ncbi:hypothetical protein [Roseivivax sp.]
MSAEMALAFALCFGAGPLLYVLALRTPPSRVNLAALVVGALTLALAGITLGPLRPLAALICLWLAWIAALACATTAAQKLAGGRGSRWTRLGGSLATTLPWFGLATALTLSP